MILIDTETGTVGYEQEIVEVLAIDGDDLLAEAASVATGARSSCLSRAVPAPVVMGDQIALVRERSRIGTAPRSASAGRQLDPEALGDHIDRLYRAARSMCASPQDAEDLVQETFARVLKKPRKLRSENDLAYLLTVLRNTFISTHRAAAGRPQTINQPEVVELLEDPSVAKVEAQIQASEVYRAIGALPPDFRDAVAAVDLVGLSYRAAAVALHVREATVTTRLFRGRQQIASALCDSFPDPPVRARRRRSDTRAAA